MPAIQAVTLDWGDTIAANMGMPHRAAQRHGLDRLGVDLAALGCAPVPGWVDACVAELDAQWASTIDDRLNPEHREMSFTALLDGWLVKAEALEADPHGLRRAIERFYHVLTEVIQPFGPTMQALVQLKARGFTVGILSHVPLPGAACRAWFARHGLAPYLDFYSLSSEVGWIKPSARHFRHAIDLAGVPAERILHVGDHPKRDVAGAKAMGMRTCLRLTEGIYPEEMVAGCEADCRILSIGELPAAAARMAG
jgi:FMN phosphatase YigB (HAD superfamily)